MLISAGILLLTLPITFFFFNQHIVDKKYYFSEGGTNKMSQKVQRNKTQRLCNKPLKAQNKRRTLNFVISEAQRNFRNKLFDSIEA